MATSNEQIQAYLRSLGVDPGLFGNVAADQLQYAKWKDATGGMGDYAQYEFMPTTREQYLAGIQDPTKSGEYRLSDGQFSTVGGNYGLMVQPDGSFTRRVKVGDKESVEVPYTQQTDGSWAPNWDAAKQGSWDTNAGLKRDLKGMATVLGAAAGSYFLGPAGAGAEAGTGSGAGAAYGLMDPSLMAPGAFEAAMGAAPAAAASPWGTAGEVIGSSGTAGGAASTLPAAATPATAASPWGTAAEVLGPTAGAGAGTTMSSFFPSTLGGWGSTIGNLLPLIGAVGGAAQGSQNQTITNQTQLPPWLQALGPQLTNAAVNAANQPFQPYGGQRIEPFNPTQQAAFGMVQNRAMNGSPVERAGQDAVTRGATGNANPMFGLDNPYLNKQIDNTLGDLNRNFERTVLPNIDAMNTRANTGFGTSSAVNGAGGLRSEAYRNLNETAAKTANDMRYKDYYTQTQLGEGMAGRQLQAAGLAPNLGALDYRNADALLGIGNQQQQLGQAGQDFNYQEFLRQLQYPDQQLQRLGYPFGFQQGSTTTSTQPGVGAVAGGISGLLGGIGMSNMIGRGGTAVSGPATMTPPPRTTLPSNGYGLDGFYPYAWGGA